MRKPSKNIIIIYTNDIFQPKGRLFQMQDHSSLTNTTQSEQSSASSGASNPLSAKPAPWRPAWGKQGMDLGFYPGWPSAIAAATRPAPSESSLPIAQKPLTLTPPLVEALHKANEAINAATRPGSIVLLRQILRERISGKK
jgi:hypothetical protein